MLENGIRMPADLIASFCGKGTFTLAISWCFLVDPTGGNAWLKSSLSARREVSFKTFPVLSSWLRDCSFFLRSPPPGRNVSSTPDDSCTGSSSERTAYRFSFLAVAAVDLTISAKDRFERLFSSSSNLSERSLYLGQERVSCGAPPQSRHLFATA
uniref:(northern house mosquito) hypothetical protein n=1 Tax=Culex pipiens TaxID=7175 RepID=A0A8D8ES61_CULPI